MLKPKFNPKFKQWEISWKFSNGAYSAVWGNTKEECIQRYKEAFNDFKKK